MQKFSTLIFALFLTTLSGFGQASVEGTLFVGDPAIGEILSDWPVIFYLDEDLPVAEGNTDGEGRFYLSTDATIAGGPLWWVETTDLCSGEVIRATFEPVPGQLDYIQNVVVCEGINPPPPPDTCHAFFSAEQTFGTETPLAVAFFDLSFGPPLMEGDTITWFWDFGDGATSTDPGPVHTYDSAGIYVATLTYTNGDCQSTIAQDVLVTDLSTCDCPTDEVIPICVRTPSGQILTFDNECWAECAGFHSGEWYVCNEDCWCPEVYDPVCVLTAAGDTISFTNACFAECEGLTEEEYFSCIPSTDCNCPEYYDPVCVATPGLGLILTFDNACFAECEGYGPEVYYSCDGSCHCPEFYSPVCVTTATGEILTFDNYCFAECEGFGPDQWMECEPECDCPDTVYDPVCVDGIFGRIVFPNACEAECAGFEPGVYQPCDGDCACPEIYEPVCVIDPSTGAIVEFGNYCLAQCAGYNPDQWLECETEPCDCPEDLYDPVCVRTATGVVITFDNPCLAACAGYSPGEWTYCGEEPCECPEDLYDPVCVQGPIGIVEFINPCEAECAGYTEADWLEDCATNCECDDIYAPVCVLDETFFGYFDNACLALCAGYTEDQIVPCNVGCMCPEIWDPVCVIGPDGEELMFANACEAECAGFEEELFIPCNDCECDDYYLPVCVETATGELIEFPNPCTALCEGFGPDDILDCEANASCRVAFEFDFISDDGLTVQFHDLSMLAGGTGSWFWDFGDGNTSTDPAPVHTYAAPGVYDVTLLVANDTCGILRAMEHICVGEGGGVPGPDCQAFFFLEQPDPDNLLTFQFLNLSMGENVAYAWDFGDGNTSTEMNPLHTYAEADTYEVTLTVFGENCESTVAIDVTAGENIWYGDLNCRAWFLPLLRPDSNAVFLVNLSSPDAISFEWDFGDGTTSDQPLAYHQYAEPGVYTITLTITTAEGCTDTFVTEINFGTDNFSPLPPFDLVNDTEEATPSATALKAWPNPANGELTVTWTNTQSLSQWQLLDINGRLLEVGQTATPQGEGRQEVQLQGLPAGIYLFRLQAGDQVHTLRVSKL